MTKQLKELKAWELTMRIEVAMPNLGKIYTEVVGSMISMAMSYKDIDFRYYMPMNSLVYDARNKAINQMLRDDADYLLFIDSDIIFPVDALKKAIEKNAQVVTGIYYARAEGIDEPIIYKKIRPRTLFKDAISEVDKEVSDNAIVSACGMGFCLIKREVILRMLKRYKSPFEPYKGLGEDFSFCYRLNKLRVPIVAIDCDLKHIGTKHYGKKAD